MTMGVASGSGGIGMAPAGGGSTKPEKYVCRLLE